MNGEPLPFEHGFPVRLVVPGLYGYVSATKWVTELKVTTYPAGRGLLDAARLVGDWADQDGVAHRRAAGRAPSSRRARSPSPASPGRSTRGISKVEVQVDQRPWTAGAPRRDASIDTWRQWVYEWDATPGSHDIRVRAYDAKGEVQSPLEAPPAPTAPPASTSSTSGWSDVRAGDDGVGLDLDEQVGVDEGGHLHHRRRRAARRRRPRRAPGRPPPSRGCR